MKFLYERVGKLIGYVTGRIDHFDNDRSKIFTVSVTLLGLSVTVLTFGINYLANAPWFLWSVMILMAAAILAMGTHLYQSDRSYSFKEAVQDPWFHTGNLPKFKDHKGYPKSKEDAEKAFCMDVAHNYTQMAEEDLASALERDIGQLVKLYAILAYKEKDAKRTADIIERGLGLFILFLIILYVMNLAMPLP